VRDGVGDVTVCLGPWAKTLIAFGDTVLQLCCHRFDIKAAANADQLIAGGTLPRFILQLVASACELKEVAGGAFFKPKHAFHPKEFGRKVQVDELLKFL
jgi:hypothetical protein